MKNGKVEERIIELTRTGLWSPQLWRGNQIEDVSLMLVPYRESLTV